MINRLAKFITLADNPPKELIDKVQKLINELGLEDSEDFKALLRTFIKEK